MKYPVLWYSRLEVHLQHVLYAITQKPHPPPQSHHTTPHLFLTLRYLYCEIFYFTHYFLCLSQSEIPGLPNNVINRVGDASEALVQAMQEKVKCNSACPTPPPHLEKKKKEKRGEGLNYCCTSHNQKDRMGNVLLIC